MSVPEYLPDPKAPQRKLSVEQVEAWCAYLEAHPVAELEGLSVFLKAAAAASRELDARARMVRGSTTVRRS